MRFAGRGPLCWAQGLLYHVNTNLFMKRLSSVRCVNHVKYGFVFIAARSPT